MLIWNELLATTIWQGTDPKAMRTTFSDIASLSHQLLYACILMKNGASQSTLVQ